MAEPRGQKRMNVYVNPEDLARVARDLGCRPSEAIRRLIDNYLLARDIDDVRQMPGSAPEQVFRIGPRYQLPAIPDDITVDPVE